MLKNLRYLSLWQRRLVFFMVFGGILMVIVLITWLLARQALFSAPRALASSLNAAASVSEYTTLPGDDAYPAALAIGADGVVFTGSYKSGAIWRIDPDGAVTEIPGTRDAIGAVSAIAALADGALLVVDQLDADPRTPGGAVVRVDARTGAVAPFASIDDETGFVAPNDIAIDSAGAVYISDPGRNEVWRFTDGVGTVWWVPPPAPTAAGSARTTRRGITGLAYDAPRDDLLITDPEVNDIFRVDVATGATTLIYQHGLRERPPGFDGLTVAEDGAVYVAALGTNGVALLQEAGEGAPGGANGSLIYLAGGFRGASDVKAIGPGRLIVANFDQASLAPLPVPLFAPQLPFALDLITLTGAPS